MSHFPRATAPRTRQQPNITPLRGQAVPPASTGLPQARAGVQVSQDIQQAALRIGQAATRIQDREDSATISSGLAQFRASMKARFVAEQLDGVNFRTQDAVKGFAVGTTTDEAALLESFGGSQKNRAFFARRLGEEKAAMQDAAVTQGISSSRAAVMAESSLRLSELAATTSEDPSFLASAIVKYNEQLDIGRGSFDEQEEDAQAAAGLSVLGVASTDKAFASGDIKAIGEALENAEKLIHPETLRKLRNRASVMEAKILNDGAARRAKIERLDDIARSLPGGLTPEQAAHNRGFTRAPLTDQGKRAASSDLYTSITGEPIPTSLELKKAGIEGAVDGQAAIETLQLMKDNLDAGATISTKDVLTVFRSLSDPVVSITQVANKVEKMFGVKLASEDIEKLSRAKSSLKKQAPTLGEEIAQQESLGLARSDGPMTLNNMAVRAGRFNDKDLTLQGRLDILRSEAAQRGEIVTSETIGIMLNASSGEDPVEDYTRNLTFIENEKAAGQITEQQALEISGMINPPHRENELAPDARARLRNSILALGTKIDNETAGALEHRRFQLEVADLRRADPAGGASIIPADVEGQLEKSLKFTDDVAAGRILPNQPSTTGVASGGAQNAPSGVTPVATQPQPTQPQASSQAPQPQAQPPQPRALPLENMAPTGQQTSDGKPALMNRDGSIIASGFLPVPDPDVPGFFLALPTVFNGKLVADEEALAIIAGNDGVDPETGVLVQSFSSFGEALDFGQEEFERINREFGQSANPALPQAPDVPPGDVRQAPVSEQKEDAQGARPFDSSLKAFGDAVDKSGEQLKDTTAVLERKAGSPQPFSADPKIQKQFQALSPQEQAVARNIQASFQTLNKNIKVGTRTDPDEQIQPPEKTFFELAGDLTGLGSGARAMMADLWFAAPFAPEGSKRELKNRKVFATYRRGVVTALQANGRYPEGERKAITDDLDLLGSTFGSESGMQTKLWALDIGLADKEATALRRSKQDLGKEEVQQAKNVLSIIRGVRARLIPPRFTTVAELKQKVASGEWKVGMKLSFEDGRVGRIKPKVTP